MLLFLSALLGQLAGAEGPIPKSSAETDLPDLEIFKQQVKGKLRSDRLLLSQYTYKVEEVVNMIDKKGEVKKTESKVHEVFPSLEEKMTYRRLIAEDGEPVSQKKLEKQDNKHQKKLDKRARKLEREATSDREKRLAKEAEELRKEEEVIDELFRLYEMEIAGRETLEGCSSIYVDFAPRPNFKTKRKEIKFLKKIKGRVWVCEADHEVIRLEAEMIESASWVFGVFGKLYQGSRLNFQRRKVNDEIWLPYETEFFGSGRLLFFKFRFEGGEKYWDYRKFTVGSSITYHSDTAKD